jgi:hypothetical protein
MKRIRHNAIYIVIVIIIAISIIYCAINAKRFDLEFPVDREQSEVQIDNVVLTGTLIRFPLNLYYIKGYLTIGDNTYKLANYKRVGFNEVLKINMYTLEFIDNRNSFFHGGMFLNGDIIQGNLTNINISIDIMDKTNGYSHSQVINISPIQD